LKIEYVSEGDPGQTEDLAEGRYHAGIGTLPVDDVALSAVCLYQEPMLVVLRKDHRLARKRRVHVSELGDDPVIWVPPKVLPSFYSDFLEWCRKQGYAPNVKQYVTSISEILDFVAEGVGVGFVKASASKLRPDTLAFCPVGNPTYLVRTGIIYRTDSRSQILRGLVVGLTNRFPCAQNEISGQMPPASSGPRARSK
jgi:DNA-binding transcriptional LysR family regulator